MIDPHYFMLEELTKLCAADVSYHEARGALKKLKELEKEAPTAGQLSRGALAGGASGTLANLARGLVKGEVSSGVSKALKRPGVGGKLVGLGGALGRGLHGTSAAAAGSAAFGASLPIARRTLDREAEKDKLRTYLGQNDKSSLRRYSKQYLGV